MQKILENFERDVFLFFFVVKKVLVEKNHISTTSQTQRHQQRKTQQSKRYNDSHADPFITNPQPRPTPLTQPQNAQDLSKEACCQYCYHINKRHSVHDNGLLFLSETLHCSAMSVILISVSRNKKIVHVKILRLYLAQTQIIKSCSNVDIFTTSQHLVAGVTNKFEDFVNNICVFFLSSSS